MRAVQVLRRERWLPVVGYEANYRVSNFGRVASLIANGSRRAKPKVVRGTRTRKGYVTVTLTLNGLETVRFVHVLVMAAFVGPKPAGMQVRHWDGNGTNNHLCNLLYGTPAQNYEDRARHGTRLRGERGPGAKLTWVDVDEIRARLRLGEGQTALAAEFGVGQTSISNIWLEKTWQLSTRQKPG